MTYVIVVYIYVRVEQNTREIQTDAQKSNHKNKTRALLTKREKKRSLKTNNQSINHAIFLFVPG